MGSRWTHDVLSRFVNCVDMSTFQFPSEMMAQCVLCRQCWLLSYGDRLPKHEMPVSGDDALSGIPCQGHEKDQLWHYPHPLGECPVVWD